MAFLLGAHSTNPCGDPNVVARCHLWSPNQSKRGRVATSPYTHGEGTALSLGDAEVLDDDNGGGALEDGDVAN